MRILLVLILLVLSPITHAQTGEDCDLKCKSQLLRVTVAPDALENTNLSPSIPLIERVLESDKFKNLIAGPFDIPSMALPHYKDKCLEEKSEGNPKFADIDCENKNLCNQDLHPSVRRKICFQLACAVVAGDNRDQCSDEAEVAFKSVEFPDPLKIKDFGVELSKKIEIKDGSLQGCLKVKRLSVSIGAQLNFDPSGTSITDNHIRIQNIQSAFDETATPREVCFNGNVNLGSPTPLSNLKIEPQGTDPFISNEMLIAASKDLQISGLSGYSPEEVENLQGEAYRLFHPLRGAIEDGIKTALAEVLEETLSEKLQEYTPSSNSRERTSFVNGDSFMSEIGFHNGEAQRLYRELDCSQRVYDMGKNPEIRVDDCAADETIRYSGTYRREKLTALAEYLKTHEVTSASLAKKLRAYRERMINEYAYHMYPQFKPAGFDENYRKKMEEEAKLTLDPAIEKIETTIAEKQLPGLIAGFIKGPDLTDGLSFGASIPELCNELGSSQMANRKMNNCPVQVYADLKQLNGLLKKLHANGQICEEGGGGVWLGSGSNRSINREPCKFITNMGGMTCVLDEAPQIKSAAGGRYEVKIKMRGCNRIALLGGFLNKSFDTTISFKPDACQNGDLCLADATSDVSFLPGAAHLGFQEMVESKIKGSIEKVVGGMLKLPLASAVSGPLSKVPLKAQGQVDAGNGFFGVCLEPADKSSESGGTAQ